MSVPSRDAKRRLLLIRRGVRPGDWEALGGGEHTLIEGPGGSLSGHEPEPTTDPAYTPALPAVKPKDKSSRRSRKRADASKYSDGDPGE